MMFGIATVVLVVLVVGGMMVAKWMLIMARKKAESALTAQTVSPPPVAAVPVAKSGAVQGQDQKATPPTPVSEPDVPVKLEALPEPSPAQASIPPTPQESESVAKAASREMAAPPPAPTAPAPVTWPTLKLTGILSGLSQGEGAARINNQMVFVGGQIEGVTLVEIRSDSVMLKYGSETKFLKMGGILY